MKSQECFQTYIWTGECMSLRVTMLLIENRPELRAKKNFKKIVWTKRWSKNEVYLWVSNTGYRSTDQLERTECRQRWQHSNENALQKCNGGVCQDFWSHEHINSCWMENILQLKGQVPNRVEIKSRQKRIQMKTTNEDWNVPNNTLTQKDSRKEGSGFKVGRVRPDGKEAHRTNRWWKPMV